ncbi:hypothetical protein [Jeotgalibacillus proteolyticus]|uniref:Uncharacterized protein n=1 Tax=Jeotgalibacillus proteolyticus TaxID=2082395 RepID=A0A2S5G8V9_9BACL|nr:hypothetical protein [Jeotgalibacillus proteolyticus]PPA69418.1 hypothetical protein C4B60_16675 [Jeotgalibacillus proteolyticus]
MSQLRKDNKWLPDVRLITGNRKSQSLKGFSGLAVAFDLSAFSGHYLMNRMILLKSGVKV